jgi:hypothetical protein
MPQEKMTMDQVRERFPEYDDMDDMTLANAIHGRFYSDIPLADFYAQVGFNPQQDAGDNGVYPPPPLGSSAENPIDLNARPTADVLRKGAWVVGREGRPYQLTEDARNAPTRLGDVEESPGVYSRPLSVAEDVAKSFPTGVIEGLTGLAGMPGTIQQMMGGEVGQMLPGFGFVSPSGEQMNQMIRQGLGRDYYQPETVAGEYSRTFGEFLPGALAPGSALARGASVAVPAFTSETAGQIARGMSGGQRDTTAEGLARLGGGLLGGFSVGGLGAVRGGADISLRNAAEGVTPQNLQLAAALRRDAQAMGVDLTNAEAIQQVTGGGSGLGRLQRVVEGQTTRMAPMFANRPAQVQGAIEARLNQIAPIVEPSTLAPRVRDAAEGVLTRLRQRANEDAGPFYRRLPGQSLPPEQFQQLTETPSFMNALRAVRGDEEIAPLLSRELPMDEPTRMLRAQQQGFTVDAYHGSPNGFDFPSISASGSNTGAHAAGAIYASDNPAVANTYARFRADAEGAAPAVYPLRINPEGFSEIPSSAFMSQVDPFQGAISGGAPGAVARNVRDLSPAPIQNPVPPPSTTYAISDPSRVRSRFDPFAAPTPDNDLNVINEVVKQLRTMAEEAAPNSARVGGSMTRASVRGQAADLADALARQASPDYAMARDTVRGVNEAFIDPLRAGQIGALADAGPAPKLENMTGLMFPNTPFEGQAAETARALELMGEIDPSVGGPLVRQQLARQAMEAQQELATGSNQFGGANFAARAFGNPEQRRTVMGALDVVNRPDPNMAFPPLSANATPARGSDPMAQLVEVLQATGQRQRAGSETAFNTEAIEALRGGNLASGAVKSATNPLGIPARIGQGVDNFLARRNAETLADLLMTRSEDFNARLTRALNRPRGANRVRAAATLGAVQED